MVKFCKKQLGKSYSLDFSKNTKKDTTNWYCSELVWAAYMQLNIDLERKWGEPGVTPRDIINTEKVKEIKVRRMQYIRPLKK